MTPRETLARMRDELLDEFTDLDRDLEESDLRRLRTVMDALLNEVSIEVQAAAEREGD